MAPPTRGVTGGYYVFPASGTIQRQTNPILAEGLKAAGWAGPFDTMAEAHAGINGSIAQKIKDVPGSLTGINAVGDFFTRLGSANTWIRVAEFGVGGILLYVGLKSAFPAQASALAGSVKSAAKVAMK